MGDRDGPKEPAPSSIEAGGLNQPMQVGAIDAEHMRSKVAASLFGKSAEPIKIGRFTVIRRLGSGGMGVVYSAFDDQLGRQVAIKLLHNTKPSERQQSRLLREAQALARLSHPNVVQVYEVGTFRGQVFVAMEFVEGQTLDDYAEDRGQNESRQKRFDDLLDKFMQAGRGLMAAHQAGLIHRDFKPENVLIGEDGRARVLDFGLARGTERSEKPDGKEGGSRSGEEGSEVSIERNDRSTLELSRSTPDSIDAKLTATGALLGTPAYMSPEQHAGYPIDARSDQFSFCVSLWEKLFGTRPFAGKRLGELALNVTTGTIRETTESRQMPSWLRKALLKGLSVKVEERFPDMESLLREIEAGRGRKRRRLMAAGGVLFAGAIAAGLWARGGGDDVCLQAEAQLDEVWNLERQRQIYEAFSKTQLPFVDKTFESTVALLGRYSSAWKESHRQTCGDSEFSSTEDAELFGLKMLCLGQRLTELEVFVDMLSAADEKYISGAVLAAGRLSPIGDCRDDVLLKAQGKYSITPEQRQAYEKHKSDLETVRWHLQFGRYKEALELAKKTVAQADAIGNGRGRAEARVLYGRAKRRLGDHDEAREILYDAARLAEVAGDDRTRLDAYLELMWVAHFSHQYKEAMRLEGDARAALERIGSSPRIQAELNRISGTNLMAMGRYDEAIKRMQESYRMQEERLGPDHIEVGVVLNNYGSALDRAERDEEAADVLQRSLSIFERRLGPLHPYVASSRNNIGNVLMDEGTRLQEVGKLENAKAVWRQAEGHFDEAIRIREHRIGSDDYKLSVSIHNRAEVARRKGEYKVALSYFERARKIREKSEKPGTANPGLANTLIMMGRCHLGLRDAESAIKHLDLALQNIRPWPDQARPEMFGEAYFALAQAQSLAGQKELALKTGTQARASYLQAIEKARAEEANASPPFEKELKEVSNWLEEHQGEVAPNDN